MGTAAFYSHTMDARRRLLLLSSLLLPASRIGAAEQVRPLGARARVVVVGAGWGGLSAARHLVTLAPGMDVVLVDEGRTFEPQSLTSPWLVGEPGALRLVWDLETHARKIGARFLPTRVQAVDRDRRRVVMPDGTLDYDWLVLSPGVRENPAAWTDGDPALAGRLAAFDGAVTSGRRLTALKDRLGRFAGREFAMVLPPAPQRCPPAAYERAVYLAAAFQRRSLDARLTLVDPNAVMSAYVRGFRDLGPRIRYLPNVEVQRVDPVRRRIVTEVEEIAFDDAIIMPPQQGGDLLWQSGLIGHDPQGKPTGWADVDPLRLHVRGDARVFVIGDSVGAVSSLFGHYPKTGHMAWRMGRIVAREIAARAAGTALPQPELPENVCIVRTQVLPTEMMRLETRFRLRVDGELALTVQQHRIAQPQGEDQAALAPILADLQGQGG